MAVRRAQAPPVHWSVWLCASVGLAFLAAGSYFMVRACGQAGRSRAHNAMLRNRYAGG
jgi:hypothetical protein